MWWNDKIIDSFSAFERMSPKEETDNFNHMPMAKKLLLKNFCK